MRIRNFRTRELKDNEWKDICNGKTILVHETGIKKLKKIERGYCRSKKYPRDSFVTLKKNKSKIGAFISLIIRGKTGVFFFNKTEYDKFNKTKNNESNKTKNDESNKTKCEEFKECCISMLRKPHNRGITITIDLKDLDSSKCDYPVTTSINILRRINNIFRRIDDAEKKITRDDIRYIESENSFVLLNGYEGCARINKS